MVIDTSALLAVIFNEKQGPWVADYLYEHALEIRMSTVNLTEVLIIVEDKQPQLFEEIKELILQTGIRFVAPTVGQAILAASARKEYPLNLGDCFAYALAKEEDCPILTLDKDFKKTDVMVMIP